MGLQVDISSTVTRRRATSEDSLRPHVYRIVYRTQTAFSLRRQCIAWAAVQNKSLANFTAPPFFVRGAAIVIPAAYHTGGWRLDRKELEMSNGGDACSFSV